MPFYEYECSSCKFYSEVMQKITDAPLTKCPSCGKKALKKLVSAPNFRLKGGGWYETDFKGDKENKRNLAGAEKDESSSAPEPSKAESPKAEASKPESSKPESATGDSASKSASTTGGAASGVEAKSSSARRSSGGRSAKPAVRVAAAKARPAPAVSRSKATGVKRTADRKKARR